MITPINVGLLGVVLAAVALAILRRRRSEAGPAAAPAEVPQEASTWREPGAENGPLVPAAELVVSGGDLGSEPGMDGPWFEPTPAPPSLEEPVTVADPTPHEAPALAGSDPGPRTPPTRQGPPGRSSRSNRRRAVVAGVGAGVLGILLVAVFGWSAGNDESESGIPGPAAIPAAVGAPAPASTRGRSEAIAALREVDLAAVQDDTGSARRILGSIDPGVLKADPGLAAQARILRNRVRLTEIYLAATVLAEAGRYREARERMLALVPFRDAGVRARLYVVEIAKDLVAQARAELSAHPGRALALLDEAEDIAPALSAITAVRAEATSR